MRWARPGIPTPDILPLPLSITHFGPYPPTYGGVSVHIRRLHLRLLRLGWKSSVISPPDVPAFADKGVSVARRFRRRYHWLLYPGVPIPGDIIHCHDCWVLMSWVLCRLLFQGKALVITVHNQQDARRWNAAGGDRRLGARLLARLPDVRWIAVSQTVRQQLLDRGVRGRQIEVIPAFLSPTKEDSNSGVLPPPLLEFLATHHPILSIYGSKYDFVDGVDLYGFDFAVEALASLEPSYPHAGLVICVPGNPRPDYQSELRRRAAQLGCSESIFFLNEGILDGSELWRRSSVHLRPTVTDGDSIAVREALALGVPVVASDTAPRPPACGQFPSRNLEAFVKAIGAALTNPPDLRCDADSVSEAHLQAILRQYQKAVPGRSAEFEKPLALNTL